MRTGRVSLSFCLGFFVAFILTLTPALAEKRVALVIGNSAYQNAPALPNPHNDAEDMASRLTSLGFKVVLGLDLDKAGMDRKIGEFAETLSGAAVGVFFYGGHGLQIGGQNYLVPIDAKLLTARSLDFEMVRLDLVQRAMERDAKTNIIFLDACRDNPLARNLSRALGTRGGDVSRGLAAVESGIGTLISFSTQPGNVALDGDGRNSPFAEALVRHLGDEDPVTDILINVRNDVVAATDQQQVPWEHSALRAKFYFKELAAPPPGQTVAAARTTDPSFEQQAELALWKSVKDSKNPALLRSLVEQFPNGRFAEAARILAELVEKEQQQAALADLRQSDAARADAEKQSALAHEIEAKSKAEKAKKDTDYAAALEEAHKARQVAEDAERRRVEAETAAEEARKAAEATSAEREQKSTAAPITVAALPDVARTTSANRSLSGGLEALAKDLQKELKRVGCYDGSVDGKWGDGTQSALKKFIVATKIELSAEEPSQEARNVLSASKAGICAETASNDDDVPAKKSSRKRSSRSSSARSGRSSSGSGSLIFGVGKGVGIGLGF